MSGFLMTIGALMAGAGVGMFIGLTLKALAAAFGIFGLSIALFVIGAVLVTASVAVAVWLEEV